MPSRSDCAAYGLACAVQRYRAAMEAAQAEAVELADELSAENDALKARLAEAEASAKAVSEAAEARAEELERTAATRGAEL